VKTGHSAVVLHTEPDNVKALYRRAQANIGLGSHDEAEADLQDAAKLAPKEKSVARLLAVITKDKKKQAAKAKKAFGAMFA
jgi:tetratricopeptide (TPR) repeat protein